ncbi:NFX1-type zinc finger-containing protein 1 [Araneus ventricosus]|uniref:NFX1-type zinc finger-containing protein 1 n=1 Tax=Araneus ventricosus TaxID=182803 RepID=A0A4Y2HW47_ARAVE|nr:NFX1-type zinc finger-containing protein 1 [Araneus ventricosus]
MVDFADIGGSWQASAIPGGKQSSRDQEKERSGSSSDAYASAHSVGPDSKTSGNAELHHHMRHNGRYDNSTCIKRALAPGSDQRRRMDGRDVNPRQSSDWRNGSGVHPGASPGEDADNPERNAYVRAMPYSELNSLHFKTPETILCIILNEDSGFYALLKQPNVSRNAMARVLLILGKAATSHLHHNAIAMIESVVRSDNFLFDKFDSFLQSYVRRRITIGYHFESFLSLSELLVKICISVPFSYLESSLDALHKNVQMLQVACLSCLREDDQLCLLISKNLRRLYDFLQGCSSKRAEQLCDTEKLVLQNPPEDYRTIPVLPTIEDIHSPCAVLQPNLIKGRYEDGEHYLDVQFRLCREDYVKTIRDGVAEYLSLKKQGKSLNGCKNVRVYSDVRIIQQEFVHGALVHLARFSEERFSKIRWEHSKRFLTGSLLCLSSDDFETVLFATIVRRQPKELREGLLLLRFEEITDEVLTLTRLRRFVVIETSAYFEAYRHNLQALQELEATKLPMKSYIVELQKNVLQPAYITESTVYDIRPLLLPLSRSSVERIIKERDVVKTIYKFDKLSDERISKKAESVSILDDQCWPSASELNLDPSQYAAIKAALTKRFVLIQGPPGTGKTYVGLRIVQLLLHNFEKFATPSHCGPILVVCYTNHALDQFLEGALQFTNRIVRIGGRGTNEKITRYHLHNLRKAFEQRREIPIHLFKLLQQRKFELQCLIQHICGTQQYIEMCYSTVLSENTLKDSMSARHYDSLKGTSHSEDEGFVMHDWLRILFRSEDLCQNQVNCKSDKTMFSDTCTSSNNPTFWNGKEDGYEEECDETEVEFLETFRSISSEEFADFKIDMLASKDEFDHGVDLRGGKTAGGKYKRFVADNLTRVKAMSEEEVRKIKDILLLSLIDRWRLYKFWLELHISEKQKEILKIQTKLKIKLAELNELQSEVDLLICQQAQLIGVTTTGAAKYRNIVKLLNPQIVVFEEAAEILESHIVTSLTSATEQVILIGDHQQLKPSPSVHELAVQYDLDVSLFERMVQNGMPCYRLNVQHRMRPEIAALLVPHFYEDLKNHELVMNYEDMKGISKNVFFINHNYNELHEFDSKSKVNQHEATFLIKLCKYILLQGYEPSQITVLTTYSGQLLVLKRLAGDGILKGVKFTVVDNYQGDQSEIILISFVRSNEEGEIGFLKVPNRVCVALSRAKRALYCVGNFGMLMEKSPIWKNIIQILEENQAIGPSLQLTCQNHPQAYNSVSIDKDFDTLREGGCTRICEFSLTCGHTCQLLCHPYDKKHKNVKCLKACTKKCDYGHSCKKLCSEDCGPCTTLVERQMEPCGHIIKVKCCMRYFSEQKCTELCEKCLSCGHRCQNKCSSDCTSKCLKKEERVSPICGHTVEVECCNSDDLEHFAKICKKPCNEILSCGHECQGTCSKCFQGRLHIPCTQRCERTLICGHECTSSCSRNCSPCSYSCENRCSHGRCPRKCSEPCVKCHQPCEWTCPHQKCDRLCFEKCSRDICYEPCTKILRCGHPCIGLCEELCPEECRECDREKVQERFFGSEDKEDARFVRLEDCGHIFELFGLVRWMKAFVQEQRKIQPITCPKCKMVIRKNLCFQEAVKSCLEDIEKVKDIACGNIYRNSYIQCFLMEKIKLNIHKIPELGEPIVKALKSLYGRSIMEILTMENVFILAVSLEGMIAFDNRPVVKEFEDSQVQILYHKLVQYMALNKKLLINFMKDEYLTASHKQLRELSWEIHRLKLADKYLKFLYDNMTIKWHPDLSYLTHCLINYKPFREENAKRSVAQLQALLLPFEGVCVDISDLAKPTSLNVLGLSKDNWYMCPLQHLCFSTPLENQCSKCGSQIGGLNIGSQTGVEIADEIDPDSNSEFSVMSDY